MLPQTELTLLDFRGYGYTLVGAPTDDVRPRNHAARRVFAMDVRTANPEIMPPCPTLRCTEAKAAETITQAGLHRLSRLSQAAGEQFDCGAVLYDSEPSRRLGKILALDRLHRSRHLSS